MRTCPTCKKDNPDTGGFCIHCGAAMAAVQAVPSAKTVPASPLTDALRPKSEAPAADSPPAPPAPPAAADNKPLAGTVQDGAGVEPPSPGAQLSPEPAAAEPAAPGPPPPPPGILEPGTVVDKKYSVERTLGEGGMGIVYLARDIHTETEVVIKAIRSEYAHRQEFRDRILAEGRALASIDHPNVVRLNAVVVEPGALYLIMQFIEGESLDIRIERYVASQTPMALDEAISIFQQVLKGVGAAHQQGVIHRDIKPGNILMRERDRVAKVTDFGIAKGEEDAQAGRGQTKGIIGSLLYMAPEQLKGQKDIDKRVDIYALGLLLFEMLTGAAPFDAPSEFEIMKLHMEGTVPRISQMRPDVPPVIDDLIARACAKDREARFSSTDEFLAALLSSQPTPSPIGQATPSALVGQASTGFGVSTNQAVVGYAEQEPKSRLGWYVAGGLILLLAAAGGGLGGAYALGMVELPFLKPETKPPPLPPPSVPTADAAVAMEIDAAPENPLSALVGPWKTESGRIYDGTLAEGILEFRIRDAKPFLAQGYVAGEARFTLKPIPGETRVFRVEDNLRPLPPPGLSYDTSKARGTCQKVWDSVKDSPLEARFDGSRLTVDFVQATASPAMFILEGRKVVRCEGLQKSRLSKGRQFFTRE